VKKVAMQAGREVFIEVDDNILLTDGCPQGILVQQLKPDPITF
jgi:hypothetical protein